MDSFLIFQIRTIHWGNYIAKLIIYNLLKIINLINYFNNNWRKNIISFLNIDYRFLFGYQFVNNI